MAPLPDLHVSDSSEAMLSGRKPPFRLLVKCVHSDGRRINIRHAVSEGFVVRLSQQTARHAAAVYEAFDQTQQHAALNSVS